MENKRWHIWKCVYVGKEFMGEFAPFSILCLLVLKHFCRLALNAAN